MNGWSITATLVFHAIIDDYIQGAYQGCVWLEISTPLVSSVALYYVLQTLELLCHRRAYINLFQYPVSNCGQLQLLQKCKNSFNSQSWNTPAHRNFLISATSNWLILLNMVTRVGGRLIPKYCFLSLKCWLFDSSSTPQKQFTQYLGYCCQGYCKSTTCGLLTYHLSLQPVKNETSTPFTTRAEYVWPTPLVPPLTEYNLIFLSNFLLMLRLYIALTLLITKDPVFSW